MNSLIIHSLIIWSAEFAVETANLLAQIYPWTMKGRTLCLSKKKKKLYQSSSSISVNFILKIQINWSKKINKKFVVARARVKIFFHNPYFRKQEYFLSLRFWFLYALALNNWKLTRIHLFLTLPVSYFGTVKILKISDKLFTPFLFFFWNFLKRAKTKLS